MTMGIYVDGRDINRITPHGYHEYEGNENEKTNNVENVGITSSIIAKTRSREVGTGTN